MRIMKRFLSLMLAAVLVISSFSVGFGQIKASALSQATGQLGTYRLRVTTSPQDVDGTGTANNLVVTINYTDGTNWNTIIAGESSPNYFEAGNTDNITFTSVPAKPISSINYNSQGSDRWKTSSSYIDYSYNGGTNWCQIAAMGGFDGTGVRSFSYPSTYSLNTTSLNHTLTFDAAGGTGGTQIYSEYGATLPASNIPAVTRNGYTFNGWSPGVPGTGPGTDVTYTAQWTANTYYVAYNGNGAMGGSMANSVHFYDTANALTPNAYTKTGDSFAGWSLSPAGSAAYADGQPVMNLTAANGATVSLYAVWTPVYRTITFDANGGSTVAAVTQGYNTQADKPADPFKDGYTFGGWYTDSALITPVTWPYTITQNMTFYAEWNADNCYTIIFNANGGTGGTSGVMTAGDPLAAPTVTRAGYTFAGWSPAVPAAVPAQRTIYTAQWLANTYTVSYDGNGNTAGSTANSLHTYDISANLTANGFTKTGNTFLGWSANQNATAATYTDSQSVINLTPNQGEILTFFAVWSANSYTITFSANGGSGGTSASLLYGAALTAPTVTRVGYTFSGWSPEVPATVPAANATYTAQWTGNQYTVTFDPQGGTVSPTGSVVTYGSTYGAGTGGFPTPTRTGYTFGGWYTGTNGSGTKILSTTAVTITAAQTLYAKWTAITYTVAYNGNGSTGGSTSGTSHTYDTAKALRTNGFTNTGYAFTGWATSADGDVVYSDGQSVINLTAASGTTVTLYAKWTNVNVSTVTFDANGGTGGKSGTLLIGAALTAPTVTKSGYTLASWSPAVPATVPAADTTYTAQWTVNTYTVTFNPESGTVTPTTSTVTYGSTYGAGTGGLPTPVRTGYTFGGWYTGTGGYGTNITSSKTVTITSSQTLYAKWTAFTYTVAYNGNGSTGGSTDSSTHTYDTAKALKYNGFTKTGYTFAGWATSPGGSVVYTNSQSVGNLTTTNGDIINLYAVWSANTYTVAYNGNGSTGGSTASSTHTYDTANALTANGFTKTDYTFTGWAKTSSGSVVYADSQSVINLTSTNRATITLYARWSNSNTYTITFDANGGTGGTVGVMTAGDLLTAPAVTRTGYTFAGWSPAVPATVPAADTTFTAQWTANTYTINYNGNGGTGSTASSLHTYNVTASLTANGFVKTGYGLLGWATDPGAVTAAFTDGQSVINLTPTPNAVITFYAVWANQFTITFDATGGTGGTSGLMTCGAALTAPMVTRAGYTFAGWSPAVPATVPAADTTYTAQWAEWSPASDFTYTVSNSQSTITKYIGAGGDVVIPSMLGGYPVTVIGTSAFRDCKLLTSIILPASLTTITDWALSGCTGLHDIFVESGSTSFSSQNGVLFNADKTVLVYYPNSKTGDYTIPGSVKTIACGAFNDCTGLTGITIPDGVVLIGVGAFSDCTSLTNIIIPDSVQSIGKQAFWQCTGLTSLSIGSGLINIDGLAFCGCTGLISITMKSVENIGFGAFELSAIRTIEIPGNVYYIHEYAFSHCSNLSSVYFEGNAPTMELSVFDHCASGLTIYHLADKTSFTSPTWYDYPTAVFYPNGHTITFDANSGTGGTSSTMSSGGPLTAPTVTRTGYTFAGWSPEVPATVPTMDTTYTAQWAVNSYTITFEANGGTGGTSTSMLYGSTLTAPTATREGYNFIGWSPEVPATVPAADTTYTAMWAVNSYTVTFDANGGSAVTAITQDYGTTASKPADPVKAGFTFAGWYTDAALTNAVAWPYTLTDDATLYAKWTASTVHFTVSSSSGMTGDIITVSVTVSENSNLGAVTLVVPYDPAVLEVIGYSAGSILNGFALDVNNNETALTITLAAAGSTKLTAGGSILDIQFRIKGSAPAGTINTDAYIPELTDTATPANPLPFDITQGSITISKLGDVNGSGTVTAVDALIVLQAATGRITLTAEQLLAADVNKSGTVTAVDALMILQYATGKLTSFN